MKISKKWFHRRSVAGGLTLLWEPHVHPLLRCNIWHVSGRDADLLIDSGMGIVSLRSAARDLFEKHTIALATHTHHDHIGGIHEFDERLVHRSEARAMTLGEYGVSILSSAYSDSRKQAIEEAGYRLPDSGELLTAYPDDEFDPFEVNLKGVPPTRIVDEGDIVSIGNRSFQVLHLPGHSSGSVGLWEKATRWLFCGDVVYDGPLLDNLPGSNVEQYLVSMERILKLPVEAVFPGHEEILNPARFRELVEKYIESK